MEEESVAKLKQGYQRLEKAIDYMKQELASYTCPVTVLISLSPGPDKLIEEIGWARSEKNHKFTITIRHKRQRPDRQDERVNIEEAPLEVKLESLEHYKRLKEAVVKKIAVIGPAMLERVESFIYQNFEEEA